MSVARDLIPLISPLNRIAYKLTFRAFLFCPPRFLRAILSVFNFTNFQHISSRFLSLKCVWSGDMHANCTRMKAIMSILEIGNSNGI